MGEQIRDECLSDRSQGLHWEKLNKTLTENYTVIDTNMLIPQKYYVDVKINYGMQSIIHHDMLHFKIVDDLNNKYA